MEIKVSIPAAEKLLDYTASGVGAVAGPMLAPWAAKKNAEAKAIEARSEADAAETAARGQATAIEIIAAAQREARQMLVPPDSSVSGQLEIAEIVSQRLQFQESKRHSNIAAVVRRTHAALGDSEVEDHEPDHDWTARFFADVQDVSSEDMQRLWAQVLAREVQEPGHTSLKTHSILRNLDRGVATRFGRLCSLSVAVGWPSKRILHVRALNLGVDAGSALEQFRLDFSSLLLLAEYGLIVQDFDTGYNYTHVLEIYKGYGRWTIDFQGEPWELVPRRAIRTPFVMPGICMTQSGRELFRVVEFMPTEGSNAYRSALICYLESLDIELTPVSEDHPARHV
jgi:hypothetical protein